MQKCKQIFLTMVAMGLSSLLFLLGIGIVTYLLKWKADTVLLFFTVVYVLTGFIGGVVHRNLCPKKEKHSELFHRIGGGLLIGTLYVLFLIAISVGAFQNRTIDMGQVFLVWFLIAGSAATGELVVHRMQHGKIE